MRLVGWTLLVALAGSVGCSSDDSSAGDASDGSSDGDASDGSSDGCTGPALALCVTVCGADSMLAEVCRDGAWTCPGYLIRGDLDCPPGTCFNNPNYTGCCSATGDRVPMYCDPTPGSLPYAGHCPDGYDVCPIWGTPDAASDAMSPNDAGDD